MGEKDNLPNSSAWKLDDAVNQGRELPEDELDGVVVKVEKNVIVTLDKDAKETYRATFTIDPSKSPIQIDMTTKRKDRSEAIALGITRFDEEDEWELCYALPGNPRPTKFASPKSSNIMLMEMERED